MSIDFKKKRPFLLKNKEGEPLKMPALSKWVHLPHVLGKREKIVFLLLFLVFVASFSFLLRSFYLSRTHPVPKQGGIFREGLTVQPRFINPVLASSDTDQSLTELTFSGLMKYEMDGSTVPDLAREEIVKPKEGVYEVTLKDNLFWSDGKRITAEDVVFTVKTIQDPAYKSPKRTNWLGVKVEMVSNLKVRFTLEKPYYPFEERLVLKPIPKHIFKDVPVDEFALSSFNLLKAVSSGPFNVKKIKQNETGSIQSLSLERNERYHSSPPYLEKVVFSFYEDEEETVRALKKDKIDGLSLSNTKDVEEFQNKAINVYTHSTPRYFGLFFNPEKRDLFSKTEVRKALGQLIDKEELVRGSVSGMGSSVSSPVLPDIFGFQKSKVKKEDPDKLLNEAGLVKKDGKWIEPPKDGFSFTSRLEKGDESKEVEKLQKCLAQWESVYPQAEITGYFGPKTEGAVTHFQEKYSEEILAPWNFEEGTGIVSKTTRKKLNEVCSEGKDVEAVRFKITTVDQPFLVRTANSIKDDWESAGFRVEVESYDSSELSRQKIKTRDYEALLFGEMLGLIPDPYPFWHSSNTEDPGLNLALYENEGADKALEKARTAENKKEFEEALENFQKVFSKDQPATLLFSPRTLYLVNKKVKGVSEGLMAEPAYRFQGVEKWFTKTKRSF